MWEPESLNDPLQTGSWGFSASDKPRRAKKRGPLGFSPPSLPKPLESKDGPVDAPGGKAKRVPKSKGKGSSAKAPARRTRPPANHKARNKSR